jgi:hypothetical protein
MVVLAAKTATVQHGRGAGALPQSLVQAQKSDDRPKWRAAIEKEVGGLVGTPVWEEVDRSTMPAGLQTAKSQLIFLIKEDGTFKVRFVLRGDLLEKGVHYLEGASSMCAVESTRMLVSFAAAEDMALHTIDFTQAFTNAPQPNPHLYCELPDLPDELKGKICGGGKHKLKVGHLKRNLYGDVQAGRVWEQYIRHWIIKNVEGARFYINDRNAFEWSFEGESLRGGVHVDDVLFAVSGSKIRAAFVSKLAAAFKVTGGFEEATEF